MSRSPFRRLLAFRKIMLFFVISYGATMLILTAMVLNKEITAISELTRVFLSEGNFAGGSPFWNLRLPDDHRRIQFFLVRPKLRLLNKTIAYSRCPIIIRSAYSEKGITHVPMIEAHVNVYNRGHTRATDCRAHIMLGDLESNNVYPISCSWPNEGKTASLSAKCLFLSLPRCITIYGATGKGSRGRAWA